MYGRSQTYSSRVSLTMSSTPNVTLWDYDLSNVSRHVEYIRRSLYNDLKSRSGHSEECD